MPRGTSPASLANLRRGNVPTPTKRPRKPVTNSPSHMAMMNQRRRELAAEARRERERLAAMEPVQVQAVKGSIGCDDHDSCLRGPCKSPPLPAAPFPDVWTETPVVRRTVTSYDESTIFRPGSTGRRAVGRPGSNPFMRYRKTGTHEVLRVMLGRRISVDLVRWPKWTRLTWWCPELGALVDDDKLDRIATPETGPSDGDRRADLYVRDYKLVLAGKPLPADPPSTFPRAIRSGLDLDKLG